MKVLKKMLAVAVSVATMAMSVSAFAATYKDATVSMTVDELTADGKVPADIKGQMTVVVVPKNLGGASITAGDIYYINQEEMGTAFTDIITNMGLKDELTSPTNYEVRVGGTNLKDENGNYTVTFDINVEGSKYKIGDVNRSGGDADILDAGDIVNFILGAITFDDEQKKLGDVNKSGGDPDILDAGDIVNFILGAITLE